MAGVTVEGLDIGLPYLGMEVEYDFAFSISRKANGSRIVQDLGISRDVVYTTAQFRLTTTVAKQLLDKWAARERDAFTVVWPEGTFPLGPCYPNGRTLDMDILDISGDVTLDSPWRSCVMTVKFMCSITGNGVSFSTQIPQGNLSIGGIAGFTYPQVSTDISYGVVRQGQGSSKAQLSAMRAPLDEVACSTWTFDLPQANAANLQGTLIGARGGNIDVTSAVAHTIWGVRTPQDAGFGADGYDGQARQVGKSITMVQTGALRWSIKVTVEQADSIDYTLSYLDEADIAMLTTDGSSGASTFQLNPVFSDSGSHAGDCEWSSDSPHISVSSAGLVTCLVSGAAVTATISCTLNAVTKTCSVTGYATLPSFAALESVKGGKGGNASATSQTTTVQFVCDYTSLPAIINSRVKLSTYVASSSAVSNFAILTNSVTNQLYLVPSSLNYSELRPSSRVIALNGANNDYTETTYLDTYTAGTKVTIDLALAGSTFYKDGVSKGTHTTYPPLSFITAQNRILLSFRNVTDKIAQWASSSVSRTLAQLESKANCDLFYIPQNFIRYTDQGSRVNYTVIPNMGTLGASYNLTANNVPSGWFGV